MDAFEDQSKSSLLASENVKKKKEALSERFYFSTPGGQSGALRPYQLLDDLLHQGGKTDVIVFSVVIHVLHQLWYGLRVSVRLKLIAFALLCGAGDKNQFSPVIRENDERGRTRINGNKRSGSPKISSGLCSW